MRIKNQVLVVILNGSNNQIRVRKHSRFLKTKNLELQCVILGF